MEEILIKVDNKMLAAMVGAALAFPIVLGVLLFYIQIYK